MIDDFYKPLPPVLSGEASKNNYVLPPSKAVDMQKVRATSLNVLRDCPEQFYQKFCMGEPQPEPTGIDYALIGTLFHEVIESYISEGWELSDGYSVRIQQALIEHNIRKSEIINLGSYLNRIRQYRNNTLFIEHEFEYLLVPGFPIITGHIDWIVQTGYKTALIIDHKTHRQPKQLYKWMDDLQTMCYAWAVRRLLGLDWTINFKIGYINLPYDADWNCHPCKDETLKHWFESEWIRLLEQEREEKFIRRSNDTCKYCPLVSSCESAGKASDSDSRLIAKTLKLLKP